MGDEAELLHDPDFRRLLTRRSRWRWGLSGFLIGAYLLYGVLGVYFPQRYAAPFMGSALPWGMAMGLLIILLSIVLSILYVQIVNRIESEESRNREKRR